MPDEYRKYRSRRTPQTNKSLKKRPFLKRFLFQCLASLLIFSVIFVPGIFGASISNSIKNTARFALGYTINIDHISHFLEELLDNFQQKGVTTNDDSQLPEKKL